MTLRERRALFVYEAARIENKAALRPINPEPWEKRDKKFRENMMMAVSRQCGRGRGCQMRSWAEVPDLEWAEFKDLITEPHFHRLKCLALILMRMIQEAKDKI